VGVDIKELGEVEAASYAAWIPWIWHGSEMLPTLQDTW